MRRVWRRLGLRGAGLLLIAYVWAAVGIGTFQDLSLEPNSAWHLIIPQQVRAAAWMIEAVLCFIFAWRTGRDSHDWIALGAAVVMPIVRVTSYGWAWLVSTEPIQRLWVALDDHLPGTWSPPPPGYPAGWYPAFIHLALVGLVFLVAAIREIPPTRRFIGE